MTVIEIALLAGGALIFLVSFLIPAKSSEKTEDIVPLIEKEVKKCVEEESKSLRSHVDDIVDEAIEYAQEKTERSLERISNEKIMAVNEYSDTVLEEINKNHKEVMFLYDMLNGKHEELMESLSSASKTIKELKEAKEECLAAEAVSVEFKGLSGAVVSPSEEAIIPDARAAAIGKASKSDEEPKVRTLKWAAFAQEQADESSDLGNVYPANTSDELVDENANQVEDSQSFASALSQDEQQVYDEVIRLHQLGMSDVDIAKSLDLGVGEVGLIINFHR